jgi:hypothetical protein
MMRIADSRTALERGLPPIYVWRFAPHDVGRDDETKVARHEDQWRGSARDIFHVSPIHEACRRFKDPFSPIDVWRFSPHYVGRDDDTNGNDGSRRITRDIVHADHESPSREKEGVGQSITRVSNVCLLWVVP